MAKTPDLAFHPRSAGLDAHEPLPDWDEMGRRILAEAMRRTVDDLWRKNQRVAAADSRDETGEETR
jgi:hypothetical protein